MDESISALGITTGSRSGHAVLQMLVEQVQPNTLQSLARCCDLRQYVDAVGVGFDHALQPANLPLHTAQARHHLLLISGVPGGCVCDPIHGIRLIPLGGI